MIKGLVKIEKQVAYVIKDEDPIEVGVVEEDSVEGEVAYPNTSEDGGRKEVAVKSVGQSKVRAAGGG